MNIAIANLGWRAALIADPELSQGLNVHAGQVTNDAVAEATGQAAQSVSAILLADAQPGAADGVAL